MPKPTRRLKRCSKKVLPEYLSSVKLSHPEGVELWAMDEHRIGLKPILRRVWSQRGIRPRIVVNHRYQWSYVYGFVHPNSGRTFWLLMPTVSIPAFNAALAEFAIFTQAGPTKHVFLLIDGAGWHTSTAVVCPPGVHLLFLPAYSPELQPAEHLWPLSNKPLANRCFVSLDELEAIQADWCSHLQDDPIRLRSATHFHWWPDAV